MREENERRFDPTGVRDRLLARRRSPPGPVLRLAADENFNNDSVRGLIRRKPEVDIVRVQDVGLSGADDPTVLKWAAQLISVMGLPQSQLGLTIGAFMDSWTRQGSSSSLHSLIGRHFLTSASMKV